MAEDPRVIPLHLADISFPDGHPRAGSTGPVLGFAVVHAEGVLLFDTGVGTGHAEVEAYYRPRVRPIEDALADHGLSIADVTAIANSHLHFDHCRRTSRPPSSSSPTSPTTRSSNGWDWTCCGSRGWNAARRPRSRPARC
jgi:hypothetical protein